MLEWLEWARGPLFRACFAIMVLGLIRLIVLNVVNVVKLYLQARKNERKIPFRRIFTITLKWLFPYRKAFEDTPVFSLTSIIFHISIIITPIFLGAHIMLWKRGLGVSWIALSNSVADILTLIAIVSGLALFIERIGSRASRNMSRFQDYFLPLLIVVPFISGYLAMHPSMNPFSYNATMFIHVLSGNFIFLIIPFTKMTHVVLFPFSQLISELGWYLHPQSGYNVMLTLDKENEPL